MDISTSHPDARASATPTGAAPPESTSSPRLPLRWWGLGIRFLVATVGVFSLQQLSGILLLPLFYLLEEHGTALMLTEVLRHAVVLASTVGLLALWLRFVERRRLRDVGWVINLRALGWLGAGVGISVAIMGVLFAVRALGQVPVFAGGEIPAGADPFGLEEVPLWVVVLLLLGMAFLLQGIPEELLFRGWLMSIVRHRPWLAFWWTTIAFASIHLISDGGQQHWHDYLAYLAIPFGFGALAGALVLLTGSMWVAAGVHAGFHVGQYSVALFTGELLNPATWSYLIIGAAYAIPAAFVLWAWHRRRHPTAVA